MNCIKGHIIEIEINPKLVLYTFHQDEEEFSEFERFINRFQTTEDHCTDCGIILAAIEQLTIRGARSNRFRFENNVVALPTENCQLRLYCIHLHDGAILLGNGGVKTSRTYQKSPDCEPHQNLMAVLERAITEKIQAKDMRWVNDQLKGDMYFSLGDCDE